MTHSQLLNGVDFTVRLEPAKFTMGRKVIDVPNRFVTVRDDNNEPMEVVGSEYKVQNHVENLKYVDSVISSITNDYTVTNHIENARIYTSFKFNSIDVLGNVKNEAAKMRIHVVNAYDGKRAFHLYLSVWRQICSNGMFGWANDTALKKIHSKNLELDTITQDAVAAAIEDYKTAYIGFYNLLKDKKPVQPEQITSRVPRSANLVKDAYAVFEKESDKSAWGLYNSFTNVITHSDIQEMRKLDKHRTISNYFISAYQIGR